MDPVRAGDGKVYERSAIEDWIANKAPPMEEDAGGGGGSGGSGGGGGAIPSPLGAGSLGPSAAACMASLEPEEAARKRAYAWAFQGFGK